MTGPNCNCSVQSKLSRDALDAIWEELDEEISPRTKQVLERRLFEIEDQTRFLDQRERQRLIAAERQELLSKLQSLLESCRRSLSVMEILHQASLNTPSVKNNAELKGLEVQGLIDALIEITETAGDHLFNKSGLIKRNADKDPVANFLITELLHFWEAWLGADVSDPRKMRFVAICFSKITGRDADAESLRKRIQRRANKLIQSPRCEFTGHPEYIYCLPGQVGFRSQPPMDWLPPLKDKRS